jgi:hypothetical protein
MPIRLKAVIPQEGYIEVTLEGHADVSAQNHQAAFDDIVTACHDCHCSRILIDRRAVEGTARDVVQQLVGEHVTKTFPRGVRIALLIPESVSLHRFEAAVARRGNFLRLFWDRDKALAWLLEN